MEFSISESVEIKFKKPIPGNIRVLLQFLPAANA